MNNQVADALSRIENGGELCAVTMWQNSNLETVEDEMMNDDELKVIAQKLLRGGSCSGLYLAKWDFVL